MRAPYWLKTYRAHRLRETIGAALNLMCEMIVWLSSSRLFLLSTAILAVVSVQLSSSYGATQATKPGYEFWRSVFQRPANGNQESNDEIRMPKKVELGRRLFKDSRLSGGVDMSCASCHKRELAFTDGLAQARGRNDERLRRNTPSLFNLAASSRFNWDASAGSLEVQAIRPITHPTEMNGSFEVIVDRLRQDQNLLEVFDEAFGSAVPTKARILEALAAYVRSLVSPRTRFDRWVSGDKTALSNSEVSGFKLFVGKAGCVSCHSGWRFTDDELHDIGVKSEDPGNSAVEGGHAQIPSFKTPGLRELAVTAPYMHNGSISSLEGVINHYTDGFVDRPSLSSSMRRDLKLTSTEKSALLDFLMSLSSNE